MKSNRIAIFIILAVLVLPCGCSDRYKEGYSIGQKEGYDHGLNEGRKQGTIDGERRGRQNGLEQGESDASTGRAIRLYYSFILWSFCGACIAGIGVQYLLGKNLRKKRKITSIHKLFIPGITHSRSYIILENMYSNYYEPLFSEALKAATQIMSSTLRTEEKRAQLNEKMTLYKELIESKQQISEFFDVKFIEIAKKEFDKIVEDFESHTRKDEEVRSGQS